MDTPGLLLNLVRFHVTPFFSRLTKDERDAFKTLIAEERWRLDRGDLSSPLYASLDPKAVHIRAQLHEMALNLVGPYEALERWVYEERAVPEQVFFLTNAPEGYDYSYCHTLLNEVEMDFGGLDPRGTWRLVGATDPARVDHYQWPRYSSGLCQVFHLRRSSLLEFDLPTKVYNEKKYKV